MSQTLRDDLHKLTTLTSEEGEDDDGGGDGVSAGKETVRIPLTKGSRHYFSSHTEKELDILRSDSKSRQKDILSKCKRVLDDNE